MTTTNSDTIFDRTRQLLGKERLEKLRTSSVIVFGVGGVGGFAVEALARSGIGRIGIVDSDCVAPSNINRQIVALGSTIGKSKTEVMENRIRDINPEAAVVTFPFRLKQDNVEAFALQEYDYVVDAIDDVPAKILLIEHAKVCGVPVISCMGTGNKTDPTKIVLCDIAKTHTCPLAKKVRKEVNARGIREIKVVFSTEEPHREEEGKAPASMIFVPASAGLLLASEVVRELVTSEIGETE